MLVYCSCISETHRSVVWWMTVLNACRLVFLLWKMLLNQILLTCTLPSTGQLNLPRLQHVLFSASTRCWCFFHYCTFGFHLAENLGKSQLARSSDAGWLLVSKHGKIRKLRNGLGEVRDLIRREVYVKEMFWSWKIALVNFHYMEQADI